MLLDYPTEKQRPGFAAAFAPALMDPGRATPADVVGPRGKAAVKRYNVYRNNVAVGLVDALARRFMQELGPSTVVATGGFSSLIAPYSDTIDHLEPWLTLHGLRIVYERNVS